MIYVGYGLLVIAAIVLVIALCGMVLTFRDFHKVDNELEAMRKELLAEIDRDKKLKAVIGVIRERVQKVMIDARIKTLIEEGKTEDEIIGVIMQEERKAFNAR